MLRTKASLLMLMTKFVLKSGGKSSRNSLQANTDVNFCNLCGLPDLYCCSNAP